MKAKKPVPIDFSAIPVINICPKCGGERTKHTKRIAVCYACGNSWLLHPCPKCGDKLEKTQVYDSLADFYDDGPYHWEWVCKCGYKEVEK